MWNKSNKMTDGGEGKVVKAIPTVHVIWLAGKWEIMYKHKAETEDAK